MKTEEAPLFVKSYDLVQYLLGRTQRFPKNQRFVLARRIEETALDLLESVALALSASHKRSEALQSADEALIKLKVNLRLCRDLELVKQSQLHFAQGQLIELGKMIGGLQKHERKSLSHADHPRYSHS